MDSLTQTSICTHPPPQIFSIYIDGYLDGQTDNAETHTYILEVSCCSGTSGANASDSKFVVINCGGGWLFWEGFEIITQTVST